MSHPKPQQLQNKDGRDRDRVRGTTLMHTDKVQEVSRLKYLCMHIEGQVVVWLLEGKGLDAEKQNIVQALGPLVNGKQDELVLSAASTVVQW